MSLGETRRLLIRDLTMRPSRITLDAFCAQWPIARDRVQALSGSILRDSMVERDPHAVRAGFALANYLRTAEEDLSLILRIVLEPWHHSHEDIVFFLADLRRPECLPAFVALGSAEFDYLAYDDAHALAVKCIWGIGKLGTEEAVSALASMMQSADPIRSRNAAGQLERLAVSAVEAVALKAVSALESRPPQSAEGDE